MNLHGIVSGIIGAVNPMISVSVQVSTGTTIRADGTPVPSYDPPVEIMGQVQPLTANDLRQLEGINLGGVRWKIYLSGEIDAIVRPEKKGGDLVTILSGPHQGVWLTVLVMEQWPDWCVCAVVQQNGS
jgi:hypothetical protein